MGKRLGEGETPRDDGVSGAGSGPRPFRAGAAQAGGGVILLTEVHCIWFWYPRQDSNLRTWFRKPLLYPLSYGGVPGV